MPKEALHTEAELLSRLAQGDEPAFNELFTRYREKLYHYLLKLTHVPEISEEIVIDIFVKIWQGRELLVKVDSFEGFLLTVARNKGIDFLRTTSRQARLQQVYKDQLDQAADKQVDDILIDAELRTIWLNAINQLPPQQKIIYRLRNEEGMSYDEIANALNLSRNTVRNHLATATQSLSELLKKQYPGNAALTLLFL